MPDPRTVESIKRDQYISGGYFVTKLTTRPAGMTPHLLPDVIVSASNCLVDIFPDSWALPWALGIGNEERQERATKFGLSNQSFEKLMYWTNECFNSTEIGYPNLFINIDDATTFIKTFASSIPDIVLLGIGLHESSAIKFLSATKPEPGEGMSAIYYSIDKKLPLTEEGQPIGFEILNYGYGHFHSWLCNDLQTAAKEKLNISPGNLGLISTSELATKVAEYSTRPEVGAEPGLWLPWLVVQYN